MTILQLISTVFLFWRLGLTSPVPASAREHNSVSARDTQFQLPSTVTLIAQSSEGNLGCINAYGHFTRSLMWCYPFRVFYTDGNNGNDGNLFGWDYCRLSSGPLDGATMDCYDANFTTMAEFWSRDGYVSIDGPTGTYFSINAWPSLNDTIGVPLTIGASGTYQQFQLYAKKTSG